MIKQNRYSYLIQQTHPDYADINEAHKKISDIATWVNESQRASEKQSKIKFYQESMVGMEGVNNYLIFNIILNNFKYFNRN